MDILIQKYDPAYWNAICQIHDEARKIELEYASLKDAFLPLEIAAEQEGLFDYNHVDVALVGHQVAGFCAYSDEELAWLYVSPDKMRQGIGKQLVANALSTEKNLHSVEVLVGNEPAKKLYESSGFTVKEILSGRMPGNERFHVKVYSMCRDIRQGT